MNHISSNYNPLKKQSRLKQDLNSYDLTFDPDKKLSYNQSTQNIRLYKHNIKVLNQEFKQLRKVSFNHNGKATICLPIPLIKSNPEAIQTKSKFILSPIKSKKNQLPNINAYKTPCNGIQKQRKYTLKTDSKSDIFKICDTADNINISSKLRPLRNNQNNTYLVNSNSVNVNSVNTNEGKQAIILKETLSFNTNKKKNRYKILNIDKENNKEKDKEESYILASSPIEKINSSEIPNDNDNNNKEVNPIDASIQPTIEMTKRYELSQQGRHESKIEKVNQDSYIMLEDLFNLDNYTIMGVMDGHGRNGHLVSNFIKENINKYYTIEDNFKSKKNSLPITQEAIYKSLSYRNYKQIQSFYLDLEDQLRNEKFDAHYSGSTCVLVFIINSMIICSNTGDSRAILVKHNPSNKNNPFSVEALSNDHKPNSPLEKERIEAKGGVVKADINDSDDEGLEEIYRVYVKNERGPGIAISRTIGDEVAASIGVIPNPEIIQKKITNDMAYIVLGSDGLWDFMSNDLVMEIVNPYFINSDAKGACVALVNEATRLWLEEGFNIDDITCVVYFLKTKSIN